MTGDVTLMVVNRTRPVIATVALDPLVAHDHSFFMLEVTGAQFDAGALVTWNGQNLQTERESAEALIATVPVNFTATSSEVPVTVRNGNGMESEPAYVQPITPLRIDPRLPMGVVGMPYSGQVQVQGGIAPYYYSAENLPQGLTLDYFSGKITGVPVSEGAATFSVYVIDSTGSVGACTYGKSMDTPSSC